MKSFLDLQSKLSTFIYTVRFTSIQKLPQLNMRLYSLRSQIYGWRISKSTYMNCEQTTQPRQETQIIWYSGVFISLLSFNLYRTTRMQTYCTHIMAWNIINYEVFEILSKISYVTWVRLHDEAQRATDMFELVISCEAVQSACLLYVWTGYQLWSSSVSMLAVRLKWLSAVKQFSQHACCTFELVISCEAVQSACLLYVWKAVPYITASS
jgi:hypothetical protein